MEYQRPIKLWLWTMQDKSIVIYEYSSNSVDNAPLHPNEEFKRIPVPTFICAHKTKLVWQCGDLIEIRDAITNECEIIPNPNANYINMLGNRLGAVIDLDDSIYWYTDTWTKLTMCPTPMVNLKFAENHAYAIDFLPDGVEIWRYDTVTGQWVTLPVLSLDTTTYSFNLATVNNTTYAVVGVKTMESPITLYRLSSQWELVVVSQHDFLVNEVIGYGEYIFMDVFDIDYTNRVIAYNLEIQQWTYLPDHPNIVGMSLV